MAITFTETVHNAFHNFCHFEYLTAKPCKRHQPPNLTWCTHNITW